MTGEDWRIRAKWYEYEQTGRDVVKYTSTYISPWELVPANSKHFARIDVLQTFCDYLEKALKESE